jgi:carbamoyl-phosphate synthase large subunit
MNFLILSCGTRNKVVQYFKRTFKDGKIVATDCSEIAPALFEADKYYIVPRITADGYLDVILDICRKEKIGGVLSLIDPELNLLAKNHKLFDNAGIKIIGSSFELCERSLDKFKMYNWLVEHGYKCVKSYMVLTKFYADLDK